MRRRGAGPRGGDGPAVDVDGSCASPLGAELADGGSGRPRSAAAVAAEASLLEDLLQAFPRLPWKIVLKTISFAVSLIAFLVIPSLRVENGSVDACDPVRTYGEIPEEGMRLLLLAAGMPDAGSGHPEATPGAFVDIGSGAGAFPIWACVRRPDGPAFSSCRGLEVQGERHHAAQAALARAAAKSGEEAAAAAGRVQLIHGDAGSVSAASAFVDVQLAYWNNLCFPEDVSRTIAGLFVEKARPGAELWTLADLPGGPPNGLQKAAQPNVSLPMGWRPKPYEPVRYVKRPAPSS